MGLRSRGKTKLMGVEHVRQASRRNEGMTMLQHLRFGDAVGSANRLAYVVVSEPELGQFGQGVKFLAGLPDETVEERHYLHAESRVHVRAA